MKILLLSPWLPWPPFDGARIRIFETLRYLSRYHKVTLLAHLHRYDKGKDISPLKELCERIETTIISDQTMAVLLRLSAGLIRGISLIQSFHYNSELAKLVWETTSRESYDIIQVEFPFMARYASAINPQCCAKKVLSMHNIESNRFEKELRFSSWNGRRLLLLLNYLLFNSWEKKAIQQFDGITVVSIREQKWIQDHAPDAIVELVPNGVDTKYFFPSYASEEDPSIVFTGLMDYPPNVDAVIWFCNEILPIVHRKLPNLCFKIVGRNPHPKVLELGQKKGVYVTGEVIDIRPYIAESSAFIVPLRSGGGTRLKILQAMAMERPVISTGLGAEGLEVTHGVDILIADNADQFANHILWLLTSPEVGNRIGKAGRSLVVKKYDWEMCLRGFVNLYDKLLRRKEFHRITDLPEPKYIWKE